MWPALKAHHDTPTPGGLSPHQILFGRDPLGRGLPLSGDCMAMDAKEFFAQQEATARDIRQQLEKEHAERQKSAPSSTAQKFRVGDPVWVIRPRPMGTHRTKTWFTPGEVVRRIGEDTYQGGSRTVPGAPRESTPCAGTRPPWPTCVPELCRA